MAAAGEPEAKADLTPEVDDAVPRALSAAEAGRLTEGISILTPIEKRARQGNDARSSARLTTALVQCCAAAKDWEALSEQVQVLCKKRGQPQRAVTAMIQEGMASLESVGDVEAEKRVIETLRTVTEGRMFVEVERARLTKRLASMYESEGDIAKASDLMQEVSVETIGAMGQKEKANFLMEQLRLTLAQRDFIRMAIVSNKVSGATLARPGMKRIRRRFCELMIRLHLHKRDTKALVDDYEALFETFATPAVPSKAMVAAKAEQAEVDARKSKHAGAAESKDDDNETDNDETGRGAAAADGAGESKMEDDSGKPPAAGGGHAGADESKPQDDDEEEDHLSAEEREEAWKSALSHQIMFAALSELDEEVSVVLHRLLREPKVEHLPAFQQLLRLLTTDELIVWPSLGGVEAEIASHPLVEGHGADPGTTLDVEAEGELDRGEPDATYWWRLLHKRIVQHNLRVLAKYYRRVRMGRAADLLQLTEGRTEEELATMVSRNTVFAKMDRPAGIISFERPKPHAEALSDWSADVSQLLKLVERTTHLINKEHMVHGMTARGR